MQTRSGGREASFLESFRTALYRARLIALYYIQDLVFRKRFYAGVGLILGFMGLTYYYLLPAEVSNVLRQNAIVLATSNLSAYAIPFISLFFAATAVSEVYESGEFDYTLSKPVGRIGFILGKLVGSIVATFATILVGTSIGIVIGYAVFGFISLPVAFIFAALALFALCFAYAGRRAVEPSNCCVGVFSLAGLCGTATVVSILMLQHAACSASLIASLFAAASLVCSCTPLIVRRRPIATLSPYLVATLSAVSLATTLYVAAIFIKGFTRIALIVVGLLAVSLMFVSVAFFTSTVTRSTMLAVLLTLAYIGGSSLLYGFLGSIGDPLGIRYNLPIAIAYAFPDLLSNPTMTAYERQLRLAQVLPYYEAYVLIPIFAAILIFRFRDIAPS